MLINKEKIIGIIVVLVILSGIAFYFYYKVEKPEQNYNAEYVNLSIIAKDRETIIPFNYEVYVEDSIYRQGKTLENGYILEKIPLNKSFYVIGFTDNEKLKFYPFVSKEKLTISGENYRVEIKPKSYGRFAVSKVGNLGDDKIILSSEAIGFVSDIIVCEKWSFAILDVSINGIKEIENPKGYENYDKCLDIGIIENARKELEINYTLFDELGSDDYIEFVFIDTINFNGNKINIFNEKDLGIEDYIFTIESNF